VLALAGIAELDIERDLIAGELDVARRARGDEVFPGIGVDEAPQNRLDLRFAEWHGD